MSLVTVSCWVSGEGFESKISGPVATFLLSLPLTLDAVNEAFPFEGTFHFRILVPSESIGIRSGSESLWLDLTSRTKINFLKPGDAVRLHALMISDASKSGIDYEVYLDQVNQLNPSSHNRSDRQPVQSDQSSSQSPSNFIGKFKAGVNLLKKEAHTSNITLKSVSQSANNVWNTLKASLTSHIGSSTSLLTDVSEENLSKLSEDIAAVYTDSNPEHAQLLRDVWLCLFPNDTYSRQSSKWKEAGFQTNDPTADLKTSGILALRLIVYMAKSYPLKTQEMLKANKENVKTKYPFAIVAVNISILLGEVLNLRDQRYLATQAGYWEMFESPIAFAEVFCILFFHIDSTWKARGAVRSDFGRIIGEAKSMVTQVFARNPKSLSQFRQQAVDVEMRLHS